MPYIPQYLQIQAKQTTQGFSLYVCLALLMANTLRIIFWFGNHFETPLLVQSILMNLTMFALIHLCVKISNKEYFAEKRKGRHFTDFDPDYFWRWTDFLSYLEFVMTVALLGPHTNYLHRIYNLYHYNCRLPPHVLLDRLPLVCGICWLYGSLYGGLSRSSSVLQKFQEQVHLWHESADGDHVDLWRYLQNYLLCPQENSASILYLRLPPGRPPPPPDSTDVQH